MEIFVIWLLAAIGVGLLASSRGRSGLGFFALAVILSPLLGLIIVLVIDNKAALARRERERVEDRERELASIKAIAAAAAPVPAMQVPIVPQQSPESTSIADEIIKLASLKDRGLLTEDEFQAQKSKLLRSA